MYKIFFVLFIFMIIATGCKEEVSKRGDELMSNISQFAEIEITYDESLLDERQQIVVDKLYKAAKIIDDLFLEQVYEKNIEIKKN